MANINGTKNDDILVDAGDGIDAFNGKGGIDTLVSEFTWADNAVFDLLAGEMVFNGNTYDTYKNIENLTLGGAADVIGDAKDNVFKFVDAGGDFHDNEVHAGGGNDKVLGGIGEDRLYGDAGNDILKGGQGNDVLLGKTGNDILKGGDGGDSLLGGKGNDFLYGGTGGDELLGNNGKDTLIGGQGDDWLVGGKGNDFLQGGAGDDTLFGGFGKDNLKGGSGDDKLIGGPGDDVLKGGQGMDEFRFYSNDGFDVIQDFEDGTDLLDLIKFGFSDAAEALSHFVERGSASNDVVGFEYNGTTIKIKGLDLADIDASDLII